jgi:CRP-like cAMP-binding protein
MMSIKTRAAPEQVFGNHPFLQDLEPHYLQFLTNCASEHYFATGQYILRQGEAAKHVYLIDSGKVALGMLCPRQGFTTDQILETGEVLGWSWFLPPYYWQRSALTIFPTRVIALDATCLREKCEADHDFGYELIKRLSLMLGQRLSLT